MSQLRQPPSIDAYGGGGFRVSGQRREGSLLIVDDAPQDWPVRDMAELTVEALRPAFTSAQVEFVLLGTGAAQSLPSREIRDALAQARIGLEFMDTPSAARLYNVLASEGRRLCAALIAI